MARKNKYIPVNNTDIVKKLIKRVKISDVVKNKMMIFCNFKMRWYAEELYSKYLNKEITREEALYRLTTVKI